VLEDSPQPRGGEVVSRQAHNLEIAGSNPAPATSTQDTPARRAEWACFVAQRSVQAGFEGAAAPLARGRTVRWTVPWRPGAVTGRRSRLRQQPSATYGPVRRNPAPATERQGQRPGPNPNVRPERAGQRPAARPGQTRTSGPERAGQRPAARPGQTRASGPSAPARGQRRGPAKPERQAERAGQRPAARPGQTRASGPSAPARGRRRGPAKTRTSGPSAPARGRRRGPGVKAKNQAEPEFHQAVEEVSSPRSPSGPHPEYRQRQDPRADHRARARDHVPRPWLDDRARSRSTAASASR
jgi:hypothetical protein